MYFVCIPQCRPRRPGVDIYPDQVPTIHNEMHLIHSERELRIVFTTLCSTMKSIPSTSASRMRKYRASLSVENREKQRAADRLRKSRKKEEANRKVIPAASQLDIGNSKEVLKYFVYSLHYAIN